MQRHWAGDPEEAQRVYQLGNAFRAQGRTDQAIAHYERALSLNPDFVDAHNNLGNVFLDRNRTDEAIHSYRRALELNPYFAPAHYNLGNIFIRQGRLEEAIENFRQAVRLAPDFAEAHRGLGTALLTQGKRDEAMGCFQEVLRINPGSERARYFVSALGGTRMLARAPADYVRNLFDNYAEHFDVDLVKRLGYRVPELMREIVRRVLDPGRVGLDVLDLGCGTGLCGPLFRDLARTLTGIDLSSRMIDKARDKGVYDELLVGDITGNLRSAERVFDLIIAADVFIYIGDLRAVFATCAAALRSGGLFVFSAEAVAGDAYVLQSTARYAHSENYIRMLALAAGFAVLRCDQGVQRREKGAEINGYIFVLRRDV